MNSFLILEKYVPTELKKAVARAVLMAQDIQEDSWDDRLKRYNINRQEAANQAVEKTQGIDDKRFWADVIFTWNFMQWNEVQEWAKKVLEND